MDHGVNSEFNVAECIKLISIWLDENNIYHSAYHSNYYYIILHTTNNNWTHEINVEMGSDFAVVTNVKSADPNSVYVRLCIYTRNFHFHYYDEFINLCEPILFDKIKRFASMKQDEHREEDDTI